MSQAEIDEVYSLHKRFMESMSATGMSGIVSQLDSDVEFFPPGEPPVKGLDAVEKWCRNADDQFVTERITGSGEEYIHAGDYIIETGHFDWKLVPKSGGEPVVDSGTFLAVWKRQEDGGWKLVKDMWNTDN